VGQVWINIAAGLAACTGPLIVGALTKADPENGWRKFWVWYLNPMADKQAILISEQWIQMGLWGEAVAHFLYLSLETY